MRVEDIENIILDEIDTPIRKFIEDDQQRQIMFNNIYHAAKAIHDKMVVKLPKTYRDFEWKHVYLDDLKKFNPDVKFELGN